MVGGEGSKPLLRGEVPRLLCRGDMEPHLHSLGPSVMWLVEKARSLCSVGKLVSVSWGNDENPAKSSGISWSHPRLTPLVPMAGDWWRRPETRVVWGSPKRETAKLRNGETAKRRNGEIPVTSTDLLRPSARFDPTYSQWLVVGGVGQKPLLRGEVPTLRCVGETTKFL